MNRLLDRAILRLRALFRGTQLDASLRHEIRVHLEEQIEENIAAGMSPRQARAAAIRAFGGVSRIEEECRDTRRVSVLQNLAHDLRYTWRSLARQPLLVLAADVVHCRRVRREHDDLQPRQGTPGLRHRAPIGPIGSCTSAWATAVTSRTAQWQDLEASGALAGLAGHQVEVDVNWRGPEESVSLLPLIVTANYFDVTGVPVAMGRVFDSEEARAERHPRVAVISHGFWQKRLGRDPARRRQNARLQRAGLHRARRTCRPRCARCRVTAWHRKSTCP